MAYIEIGTTKYYYESYGHGRPIVLITGFGSDCQYWQHIRPFLENKYHLIMFDNRASGQTKDDGGQLSCDLMASDTFALIQALGLNKPHIIGYSLGGAIAQRMAAKYGKHLGQLVLMSTSIRWREAQLRLGELWISALQKADLYTLDQLGLSVGFGDKFLSDKARVDRFLREAHNNANTQSVKNAQRQLHASRMVDNTRTNKHIQNETLVLYSEEDLLIPYCDAKILTNSVSAAKLKVIPGGHSCTIEEPKLVANILTDFLVRATPQ